MLITHHYDVDGLVDWQNIYVLTHEARPKTLGEDSTLIRRRLHELVGFIGVREDLQEGGDGGRFVLIMNASGERGSKSKSAGSSPERRLRATCWLPREW